jgi:spermine oxidase
LVRQDGHTLPDTWSERIQGFYTVHNQPDMLIGWITGPAARLYEALPEAEVLQTCSDRLRKYLGTEFNYTEPEELIRTSWFTNPFTRGSYSYRSVKSKEQDAWASDLAEPVKDSTGHPRLHFAGEATHDCFYSTVHGAVESGWREADRIAPFLLSGDPKSRL